MASEPRVNQKSVEDLFAENLYFYIPEFQRTYAWRTSNNENSVNRQVNQLFDDIYKSFQAGDKNYFLGTVITYYDDKNIKPENVLITPGGKPVIFISALLLGSEDREIIFPDPGFPIYRSMIKYSGAKAVPLKLSEKDNFEINTEQLKELISDKTSLIIINNPNNPTGSYMNKKKITDLVNLLEQYPNVSILSDEIYSNIIFNNEQMPSLLEYESIRDRLIVLEGWSKTYCMTGWRLGWSIWPKNLIEHANKICVNYNSCATSISQYAGLEAIKGSQKEITKIVTEFQKRKEYVFNELNKLEKISCFEPGGAFYAFPNISKTGLNGNKFSEIALEEKGVALVPGSSFGDNAGEFVRISFANSLENIKEAINRLSTI